MAVYERKRTKPLDSNTTLRHTQPGGNARNFVNMKSETGRRAFMPSNLGCVDEADWSIDSGTDSRKVQKI
jgi:hypothetical protein